MAECIAFSPAHKTGHFKRIAGAAAETAVAIRACLAVQDPTPSWLVVELFSDPKHPVTVWSTKKAMEIAYVDVEDFPWFP